MSRLGDAKDRILGKRRKSATPLNLASHVTGKGLRAAQRRRVATSLEGFIQQEEQRLRAQNAQARRQQPPQGGDGPAIQ
jgi:hypothetical protein